MKRRSSPVSVLELGRKPPSHERHGGNAMAVTCQYTLLIFCTKFEGKFVPVAPTSKMLLSMCSVLAWAGGRAGILTDSRQLCQLIRGKLRF